MDLLKAIELTEKTRNDSNVHLTESGIVHLCWIYNCVSVNFGPLMATDKINPRSATDSIVQNMGGKFNNLNKKQIYCKE